MRSLEWLSAKTVTADSYTSARIRTHACTWLTHTQEIPKASWWCRKALWMFPVGSKGGVQAPETQKAEVDGTQGLGPLPQFTPRQPSLGAKGAHLAGLALQPRTLALGASTGPAIFTTKCLRPTTLGKLRGT